MKHICCKIFIEILLEELNFFQHLKILLSRLETIFKKMYLQIIVLGLRRFVVLYCFMHFNEFLLSMYTSFARPKILSCKKFDHLIL